MKLAVDFLPSINDIVDGGAVFKDDMPVWMATFGADIWPFVDEASPMYGGQTTSSIVWRDFIEGRGSTFGHINSFARAKIQLCLTEDIVKDLKIAAVIHGYYPRLIKGARITKSEIDPKTVKGRIDDLARFFSMMLNAHFKTSGIQYTQLSQISFEMLKEYIPQYPGRGSHLLRALKLISDPMVQKNLSEPLNWQLLDLFSKSIKWPASKDLGGIATLSDAQFLELMTYSRRVIREFKTAIGLELHDKDFPSDIKEFEPKFAQALNAYYEYGVSKEKPQSRDFRRQFGLSIGDVSEFLIDAHCSAMMAVLLLTGMRSSEAKYLMRDCLTNDHGFSFLKSKVVKNRPANAPISEGWLAISLTIDAYDILNFVCNKTGNKYLFSSPVYVHSSKMMKGYSGTSLNTKLARWIDRIDEKKLFRDWQFSIHQCRETLVYQLARQEVGMPFISMQLKYFHSQFNRMPNAVTAGYGQYRSQLLTGIAKRKAEAREQALQEVYGERSSFAGGGAVAHKVRIDTFFSGIGLYGKKREEYIRRMANSGVKLMPTSIGSCTKNFVFSTPNEPPPPCYGDYQCDPDCHSHVITGSCEAALEMRREYVLNEAEKESNKDFKAIWEGLAQKLNGHISKLKSSQSRGDE